MMQELSENILDIAQNSISANAKNITIKLEESIRDDSLIITIADDGKGMSEEFLAQVTSPFKTTRTTRKVGLGISFLKEAAEIADGRFEISSRLGVGTTVKALFVRSHIDRQPVGALADTI
jgi:signal transduction histidine kinase